MATYGNGVAGGFSGKVGSIIGSNWRDVKYIKGLSRRSKPNSPAQLAQQGKWGMMMSFLASIRSALELGFCKEDTRRKTALNIALAYNLAHAIKENENGFEIDYMKVVVSRGSLPRPVNVKIEKGEGSDYIISWSPAITSPLMSPDDVVSILVYCCKLEVFLCFKSERQDGELKIEVPAAFAGTCYLYLFFSSRNRNNSPAYVGEVEM